MMNSAVHSDNIGMNAGVNTVNCGSERLGFSAVSGSPGVFSFCPVNPPAGFPEIC